MIQKLKTFFSIPVLLMASLFADDEVDSKIKKLNHKGNTTNYKAKSSFAEAMRKYRALKDVTIDVELQPVSEIEPIKEEIPLRTVIKVMDEQRGEIKRKTPYKKAPDLKKRLQEAQEKEMAEAKKKGPDFGPPPEKKYAPKGKKLGSNFKERVANLLKKIQPVENKSEDKAKAKVSKKETKAKTNEKKQKNTNFKQHVTDLFNKIKPKKSQEEIDAEKKAKAAKKKQAQRKAREAQLKAEAAKKEAARQAKVRAQLEAQRKEQAAQKEAAKKRAATNNAKKKQAQAEKSKRRPSKENVIGNERHGAYYLIDKSKLYEKLEAEKAKQKIKEKKNEQSSTPSPKSSSNSKSIITVGKETNEGYLLIDNSK